MNRKKGSSSQDMLPFAAIIITLAAISCLCSAIRSAGTGMAGRKEMTVRVFDAQRACAGRQSRAVHVLSALEDQETQALDKGLSRFPAETGFSNQTLSPAIHGSGWA
ncbi:MAG: hypothetical protein OEZ04_12430 [Nitrospinota bacterium]|nr:hypothetical protein [Nitrospinota bacterium]